MPQHLQGEWREWTNHLPAPPSWEGLHALHPLRSHNDWGTNDARQDERNVLDGIDLHSSCVWIQTEVVREVEAKETAQVEHLKGETLSRFREETAKDVIVTCLHYTLYYMYNGCVSLRVHEDARRVVRGVWLQREPPTHYRDVECIYTTHIIFQNIQWFSSIQWWRAMYVHKHTW